MKLFVEKFLISFEMLFIPLRMNEHVRKLQFSRTAVTVNQELRTHSLAVAAAAAIAVIRYNVSFWN